MKFSGSRAIAMGVSLVVTTALGCTEDAGDAEQTATTSTALQGALGCYTDDGARALPQFFGGGKDPASCVTAVRAAGLRYAGVQYYGECWGGNSLGRSKVDSSECNTPCSSNPGENCGGAWRNSVYDVGHNPAPPPGNGVRPNKWECPLLDLECVSRCRADERSCGVLSAGQQLSPGQSLRSRDGRFNLVYQHDGNLVLYGTPWHTHTYGTWAGRAVLEGDGNFVVYDGAGNRRWHSNTSGFTGTYVRVQNDGNFVLYDGDHIARWHSQTCCR